MKWLFLVALLLVPLDVSARGGAPLTSGGLPGYSFSDIRGYNSASNWGWNGHQWTSPSRVTFQGLNSPSRYANSTLAWQIQSGDNPLGGTNTERNEVLQMFGTGETDESVASGTQYYAISVYIPSGWVDPVGTSQWFIIAQIHADDTNVGHSAQANFQFLLASNSPGVSPLHYSIRSVGGPITGSGSIPGAGDVITDLGPHVYDTWVDFVFKITWGSDVDGTGHVTVYKRVVGTDATLTQVADYSAPNVYSVGGVNQPKRYWKRGIYRNADGGQGTVTVYVSPFTRAPDLQDAATASFGSYP